MSKLKSEIHDYLLENDFSLVEGVYSSDTMFVYSYNPFPYYQFVLSFEIDDDFTIVDLESKENGKIIQRILIKTLEEFKFISTHCTSSPLFDIILLR